MFNLSDQNTNFTLKVEQMEKQNRKLEFKNEVFQLFFFFFFFFF